MNSATSPEPSGSIHLYPPHGPAAPAAPVKTQEVAGKMVEQSEPCPTDSDAFAKRYFAIRPRWPRWPKAEKMCSVEGSNPPVGTVRVDDFKHHWLYLLTDLTAVFCFFCIVLCSFRSFQIIHKQNSQNWEVFLGRISAVGVAPKKYPPGDPGDPHGFGHDAGGLVARWSSQLLLILGIF